MIFVNHQRQTEIVSKRYCGSVVMSTESPYLQINARLSLDVCITMSEMLSCQDVCDWMCYKHRYDPLLRNNSILQPVAESTGVCATQIFQPQVTSSTSG